jgi:hypothetical protein
VSKTYTIRPLRVVDKGDTVHLYRACGFRTMTIDRHGDQWRVVWGTKLTAKKRFETKEEAIAAAQRDWFEFVRQDLQEVQP